MSETDEKVAPKPDAYQFDPRRTLPIECFGTFDFFNNVWKAIIKPPCQLRDVYNPLFWAHNRKKMRPGDMIYVQPADFSFTQVFMVTAVEPDVLIDRLDFRPEGQEIVVPEDLFVKWNVGAQGFDVINKEDNRILKSGKELKTKQRAMEWIEQYVINKQMAA